MRTNAIFLFYVVVRHFYFKNLMGAPAALLSIFCYHPHLTPTPYRKICKNSNLY